MAGVCLVMAGVIILSGNHALVLLGFCFTTESFAGRIIFLFWVASAFTLLRRGMWVRAGGLEILTTPTCVGAGCNTEGTEVFGEGSENLTIEYPIANRWNEVDTGNE